MNSLIKNIKYISRKASASRINAYAAQTAFFVFLSLVPLFILSLSLFRYFGPTESEVLSFTRNLSPGIVDSFFDMYVDEITAENKLSLTIVSSTVLLWSASKGVFAIIGGLNSVYEIKENRNYFIVRLTAIFYTAAFIIMVLSALILMVFGEHIVNVLRSFLPQITGFVYIITSFRFLLSFVILVLFFSVLYKALPSGKQEFSAQIPGAILSGAGWVIFSAFFSFFVDNFSNYANIYGSLTGIIVLMLWLYVCMYIMFLGAEINLIIALKKSQK